MYKEMVIKQIEEAVASQIPTVPGWIFHAEPATAHMECEGHETGRSWKFRDSRGFALSDDAIILHAEGYLITNFRSSEGGWYQYYTGSVSLLVWAEPGYGEDGLSTFFVKSLLSNRKDQNQLVESRTEGYIKLNVSPTSIGYIENLNKI